MTSSPQKIAVQWYMQGFALEGWTESERNRGHAKLAHTGLGPVIDFGNSNGSVTMSFEQAREFARALAVLADVVESARVVCPHCGDVKWDNSKLAWNPLEGPKARPQ